MKEGIETKLIQFSSDVRPSEEIIKKLNVDFVNFSMNKWKKLNMQFITPLISQWKLRKLNAADNKSGSILKDISVISFPFLSEIVINGNQIQSLEGISRIFMPSLQKIMIRKNKFCFFKQIRKGNWKNLSEINIADNRISDLESIVELGSTNIEKVAVQFFFGDPVISSDIGWVAKMQSKNIVQFCTFCSYVGIDSRVRIKQRRTENVCQKKCEKISFHE